MPNRVVPFLLYDGLQPLDVVGPHEVFGIANRVLDAKNRPDDRYDLQLIAKQPGAIDSESGLALHATTGLPDPNGDFDTIVVPGGDAAEFVASDHPELIDWLALAAPNARRVATVCSGTFLAAAAGLCGGKRVTTHWSRAGQLARACPAAIVEPDAIYIESGGLWTSAGVTTGIDLALALVERDMGTAVAQAVARQLVVFLHRPGGQTQFATPVWTDTPSTRPIAEARNLIHADPGSDLTLATVASSVGLSERHFARVFRAEVGESPAKYIERVRVDAARQLLETESDGLEPIARRCGFRSAETLRRAFHRRLGVSPDAYRRRHVGKTT